MENTDVYKEMERKFPKKEYTCPYCGQTVTIPLGMVTAICERCGKTFFRPLPPEEFEGQESPSLKYRCGGCGDRKCSRSDPAGCKEPDEEAQNNRLYTISEDPMFRFKFFGKAVPETPLLGIALEHVPYVRCPDTWDMIPSWACNACDCIDVYRSTPDHTVCHYIDDNPGLASAIQNKEQIIAACIRGPAGYQCTTGADGKVYERDQE